MADQPVGNRGFITEVDIRIFLRDNPSTNTLLMDFEFNPEEIRTAATLCVDKWNETPPFVNNFTIDTFPFRWALTMGTTANLLTMAAHKFRRNNLTYQVAGGSVDDQNKAPVYDQTAGLIAREFNDWMTKAKIAINLEQCWGSE